MVGIEFDVRSEAHKDEDEDDVDDELEKIGEEFEEESGEEVAWGIGIDGEMGWLDVKPSKWRKINAT